ncbi:MAG: alpha/beta hydrolase [Halioglobus sp.]
MTTGLLVVVALLLAVACWLYSWTFTPHGRIRFVPAMVCRLAQLSQRFNDPVTYTQEDRLSANESVRRFVKLPERPAVRAIDHTLRLPGRELALRSYHPGTGEHLPMLLNIHGGAWWMGSDFIDDSVMRYLSAEADVVIVSVDYRLAPEHVHPAALEDCYAALQWLVERADELGGDASRLGVYGTSAGGGLATSLCLLSDQRDGPSIKHQSLVVPVTDLSGVYAGPSMEQLATGYILTASDLADMIANYVPDADMRKDPLVSPIYAYDLQGLPPAFIATAQFDPLRDMAEAFAARLAKAGVETELQRYDGVIHGFFGTSDVLQACTDRVASEIRRVL